MPTRSRIAAGLYLLGVAWLGVMAFTAAWPDMEASVFDQATALVADEKLRTLRCPLAIGADETATVGARFTNSGDRRDSFLVRARISSGHVTLARQASEQVTLEPRQTRELSWTVTADDAVYDRIVMVRVLGMRGAFQPARESSCGVLVLGAGRVGGRVLFGVGVLVGLAALVVGAVWWRHLHRPLGVRHRATTVRAAVLGIVVGTSLVTGVLGWWLPSHLLLIGSILLLLILVEQTAVRDD